MSSSANKSEYAKLKKNLLFHEKRMQLLLSSRIVEDIEHNLKEKSESRTMCADDCLKALRNLESGAMELNLSGKWSEIRIANMFGLELGLSTVVGSERFEVPQNGISHIGGLLQQIETMSQRIPEFRANTTTTNEAEDEAALRASASNNNNNTTAASIQTTSRQAMSDVDTFIKQAAAIHWTPTDLRRITDAIASKHTILKELENLANALRDAQFSASKEQVKLEALRKADEIATADGEMATEEAVIRERLETLERLIDIIFFEAHTVDASVDSNVKKRRSNMSTFINGAAVVQCIAKEKEDIIAQCDTDIRKIERCLLYEETHNGHGEIKRRIADSASVIKKLDEKQEKLQQRLKEIFKEWDETEQALEKLGHQRTKAVGEHIELLDSARHAQSDFLEMAKFAEQYVKNLETTKDESRKSIEQLKLLERILLQQQTFETYDFRATAKRLATVQRRIAFDLNRTLNEHQKCAEQLLRRLDAQSRALSEKIDLNECEAELRRDMLDPTTKKFVERARELAQQREVIEMESRKLADRVMSEHANCMEKIREALAEEDIVDDSEKINVEMMGRHEELLDLRQELVTPPEMAILDERLRVAREKQSTLAAVLQDTTRKSRILAIRNDIGRQRESFSHASGVAAGGAAADEEDSEATKSALPLPPPPPASPPPPMAFTVVTGGEEGAAAAGEGDASQTNNKTTNATPSATQSSVTFLVSQQQRLATPPTVITASGEGDKGGRGGAAAAAAALPQLQQQPILTTANVVISERSVPSQHIYSHSHGTSPTRSRGGGGNNTSKMAPPSAAENSSAIVPPTAAATSSGSGSVFAGVGEGATSSLIASRAGGILVGGISGAVAAANAALSAMAKEAEKQQQHQHVLDVINSRQQQHTRLRQQGDTTVESIDVSAVANNTTGADGLAMDSSSPAAATAAGATAVATAPPAAVPAKSSSSSSGPVYVTPTNPLIFDPNPEKLTTSAALKAEAMREEELIEQERLQRLHGHTVDLFANSGLGGGGLFNRHGGRGGGGDGEPNSGGRFNVDDPNATAMDRLNEEDEAKRRALVMRYRENEERTYRMRGKARAIADVSVGDIDVKLL